MPNGGMQENNVLNWRVFPVTRKTSNTFIIILFFIIACPFMLLLFYPVQCCNADSVKEWIFIQQILGICSRKNSKHVCEIMSECTYLIQQSWVLKLWTSFPKVKPIPYQSSASDSWIRERGPYHLLLFAVVPIIWLLELRFGRFWYILSKKFGYRTLSF